MNELGLTSQVPPVCEITTNKTAREYRRVTVAGVPIVLRKPRVKIGDKNWTAPRLLDSMKEIASFLEISGAERTRRLLDHINARECVFRTWPNFCLFTQLRFTETCTKRGFLMKYLHKDAELFAQSLAISVRKTGRQPEIIEEDCYVTMLLKGLANRFDFLREPPNEREQGLLRKSLLSFAVFCVLRTRAPYLPKKWRAFRKSAGARRRKGRHPKRPAISQ